jgi:hypothetical protein
MAEENIDDLSDRREETIAEAQALRRQVGFWRRMAWLLVCAAAVVIVVFWQRGSTHRAKCRGSLEQYARLARESKLSAVPAEFRETQWHSLKSESAVFGAGHYHILSDQWGRSPGPNERLILAVCGHSHFALLTTGRHVLVHDAEGDHVEWWPEAEASALLE